MRILNRVFRPLHGNGKIRRRQRCAGFKRDTGIPAGAIYIGRGSKWGNPFRIGPDGERATVIAKHDHWLRDQRHLLRALDELRGHYLVCFCAPLACHGDLLLWLANGSREDRVAWWRGQIDHRAWRCG